MKLHLPHLLRRAVLRALFAVSSVVTTLASASYADMITPDGRTATSVVQDGSTYNVYTNTVRGNTGFNSFSTFDVYANTTANLHLADGTGKLINVVRDSASHIDGVLNSYKNGKIGGDVYFLNPNGVFVGKSGVINVGSISMSTPTAAFVEQLIARDGSISPTATQAVMDGDMPINPEGTISVKGKVNAAHSAELRAGTVEVKGGSINTGVKFREMVNTGDRKVDTKGMNISDGKLSFGKKPAKAQKPAGKPQKAAKKTNIAIFADDVFADGAELNADSVFIDPDKLELSNLQVSGDYTLEARVIILSNVTNKAGETLTSFTLNAANELTDGTFAGNVSITLANSNLVGDTVSLNASATGTGADALITISASDIKSAAEDGSIALSASSTSGAASVNVSADTKLTAPTVSVNAAAQQGNATVNSLGTIAGTSAVTMAATTGSTVSNGDADNPVFTATGSGDATLTVGGTVSSQGSLTLEAAALGTSGKATLNADGALSAVGETTQKVGELNLARTKEETVLDTDSTATIEAKNKAYLNRYAEYLKTLPSGTAATAELKLTATSASGAAQVIQDAQSKLQASLSATIDATAATDAAVQLAGAVTSGAISATAEGKTATLRVAKGATLSAEAHTAFLETNGVTTAQQSNGAVSLSAKSSDEQNEQTPVPAKKDGVLLEISGAVLSRRSDKSAAGDISLSSDGTLSVTDTAVLDASSAGGAGGSISFSAPEYALTKPASYTVSGASLGSIRLENAAALELTNENINTVTSLAQSFVTATTGLSGDAAKAWHGSYTYTQLSGDIRLTDDVSVSVTHVAIADNTHIYGNGHSLTLENSFIDGVDPYVMRSIGNGVTIEGVKDFKFEFTKRSAFYSLVDTYFGSPLSLTVGKNFHVTAAGDVSISLTGYGNTYIEFGSGVQIEAEGDVTISANTQGGWGTNFFGFNTPTNLGKVTQSFGDNTFTQILGASELFKFNSGRFVKQVINDLFGTDLDTKAKSKLPLQFGVMVSKASVTFADSTADTPSTVTGDTITISSASTALVGGRQDSESESAFPALSITYLYNSSKVSIGSHVVMTATGADKEGDSLTITSTTTSTNSPQHYYESTTDNLALAIDVNVSTVFNEVTIAADSELTAKKNLTITGTNTLNAEAMVATSAGLEQIAGQPDEAATTALSFGLNVVSNSNKMTINGSLTSEEGDISCTTEDEISATLTMGSTLSYTISEPESAEEKAEKKKAKDKEEAAGFWGKLIIHFQDNLTFDVFGIGKVDGHLKWNASFEKDNIMNMFTRGEALYGDLWGQANRFNANSDSIAVAATGVVVVNHNNLVFNGKAEAADGSVTLGSKSSIEQNAGAESNITGAPSEKAWTGSLSVPVLMSTCTTEVGSNAVITAGENISVTSATELPMSFDVLGWNAWKEALSGESKNIAADLLKAIRGSFVYLRDYQDNGDFGLLDSLTASHASSLVTNTGKEGTDTATYGGDVVVDVRSCDTLTLIDDGASLTAGKQLSVTSASEGTHIAFSGKLPFFFTLGSRTYTSTQDAASGYGVSFTLDSELMNTVTYIGKAKLKAGSLSAKSTGDIFTLVGSAGGTFGASADSMQGAIDIVYSKHMTVTEISNGASITLTGSDKSEVAAEDDSALWNLSGQILVSNGRAVGVGAAFTINNAYTAALLGNQLAMDSDWTERWEVISEGHSMPFTGSGDISLTLGNGALDVSADNSSTLVTVGVAGSGTSDKTDNNATVAGAANVGVAYTAADTIARQDGVQSSKQTKSSVSTTATDDSKVLSAAGDVAASSGSDNSFVGAGSLSVNRTIQNTTATVTGSSYDITGDFTVSGKNTATVLAADLAVAVANSSFTGAAGSAWNSLEGTTGAYLTGGSVMAGDVSVTSANDMTSFALTLGAAVNFSSFTGQGQVEGLNEDVELVSLIDNSERQNKNLEDSLGGGGLLSNNNSLMSDDALADTGLIGDQMPLQGADNSAISFSVGASIARNVADMHSEAVITGCTVTSAGALTVTAEDESVITAIGIGAAVTHGDGLTIGAGGVFSFAPVSSTTKAAIVQAEGVSTPLAISAETLTVHATDKHRERVWSFGGGYGDTAGIGLVLSWGSFAGASTKVLLDNADISLDKSADILASSDLDATFISVGASGAQAATSGATSGALTGMVNYLNFNNQVITEVKNSSLTVTDKAGSIKALSRGKRNFVDGAGAISFSFGKGITGSVGAALSFVYVGGNGENDKNLTQTLVSGSVFNNPGTTELLAQSSTTGTLAIANAAAGIGSGFAAAGSFAWVTDDSQTQVSITGSSFNDAKKDSHKNAAIKAEATSSSKLTVGEGTLGVQVGKGLGLGLAAAIVKDRATTTATMSNSRVNNAKDFTLHASGEGYLDGLVIGAGASGTVGLAGSGMSADIEHQVLAELTGSVVNLQGALNIKADNVSKIGDGKVRFTLANGALGAMGGGLGVAVNLTDVNDNVIARAHNVSVNTGSMEVSSTEEAKADAITVNVAGGLYGGGNISVALPVLRGNALAEITADKTELGDKSAVGITTTTGNLAVQAKNNQYMRSHEWTLAAAVNPLASAAVNISVNRMNMAGSAVAQIQGAMDLSVAGDLNITADTTRTATYTTVAVSGSPGFSLGINSNALHVSSDKNWDDDSHKETTKKNLGTVDAELTKASKILTDSGVTLPDGTAMTVSASATALSDAATALDTVSDPVTRASVDLGGKTAEVSGAVTVKATDTITTTPTVVGVTGGLLGVSFHNSTTEIESTVEALVNNSVIKAKGDITIDAKQTHSDNYDAVGVAIGGVTGQDSFYLWKDTTHTKTAVTKGSSLSSSDGSVSIGASSSLKEDFTHVNTSVGLGTVVYTFPTFTQTDDTSLTIGDGVTMSAGKNLTIGTTTVSKLDASLVDVVVSGLNSAPSDEEITYTGTQSLTLGKGITLTGDSVTVQQTATRDFGVSLHHIGVTFFDFAFPEIEAVDTFTAALSIGDDCSFSAKTGALTISSDVNTKADFYLYGLTAIGASVGAKFNEFKEEGKNTITLGKRVKMSAANGAMKIAADSTHTGDMRTTNTMASVASVSDAAFTKDKAYLTTDVSIGDGFEAKGKSLTLEAYNKTDFLGWGKKVSVGLLLNPFSKNAFDISGSSSANITLAGGTIDVEEFITKARTDVDIKFSEVIGGGSLLVDVNLGKLESDISQTATVTLGTDSNKLDILADKLNITAHNKYRVGRRDASEAMMHGGDFGLVSGNSDGTVDLKQTLTASVTLGSGSTVRRRADAVHYLLCQNFESLISATNDAEDNAEVDITASGLLNANCMVTTKDQTTATATLTLNGSIDTWFDTELTAYSHVRHIMNNTVTSGAIIPTFHSWVTNTIDTTDSVIINGAVESVGNILIQSGSTKSNYTMTDGTTVLSGDDDTNSTNFFWGDDDAVIHNKRSETVSINACVRAGGTIGIYNDSSANTVTQAFKQTHGSSDYTNARKDTAAEVTSTLSLGADAGLYAGLGSAVRMVYAGSGSDITLSFITAQKIFDGSTQLADGTWQAPDSLMTRLTVLSEKDGVTTLSVLPLTLPGSAVSVVTKSDKSVLSGKVFSPERHGLDIVISSGCNNPVQINGVTLTDHETGLFYNGEAQENAVTAIAGPALNRSEGVSIRNLGNGKLTLAGTYELPYNTLSAFATNDLLVNGTVNCGSVDLSSECNISISNPEADYNQWGAAALYTDLLTQLDNAEKQRMQQRMSDIVKNGGDKDNESKYTTENHTQSISADTISAAATQKEKSGGGTITAAGTVTITGRVVDLNGKIYSGYTTSEYVVPATLQLQASDGSLISVAQAKALYKANSSNKLFRLANSTGISLCYDAENDWVTVGTVGKSESGITITGAIVNSDYTGTAGLYVADGYTDLTITNKSAYTLNIDTVDLSARKEGTVTLNNTQTGITTVYKSDASGNRIMEVTRNGSTSTTKLGKVSEAIYQGVSDYQVKVEQSITTRIKENGRLTHSGDVDAGYKGKDITRDGYIGSKQTMIDGLSLNTASEQKSTVTYSYVTGSGIADNTFVSTHTLSTKHIDNVWDPGPLYRWKYELSYSDLRTDALYLSASHDIDIHFSGSGQNSASFTATSGTINLSGTVTAGTCTLTANNAITATADALLKAQNISLTAKTGSIGTETQALRFSADAGSFTAGSYLYLESQDEAKQLKLKAGKSLYLTSKAGVGNVSYTADDEAVIKAKGDITLDSANASSAAYTTLNSEAGSITAANSGFAPGVLTAVAEKNISISTNQALTLDSVTGRTGDVSITAKGGITSTGAVDLTNAYTLTGTDNTSLASSTESAKSEMTEEYYAKLQEYAKLYYTKDADGNYTYRDAEGNLKLTTADSDLAEVKTAFRKLYDSGKGDLLGSFIFSLSGSKAVEETKFATEADALAYLAQNSDKLESAFAQAYYKSLMTSLTADIRAISGDTDTVDYGQFNDTVYRLYWLTDASGKYVNQDAMGNFVSPDQTDGFGKVIGKVYSDDTCAAITKQFKSQKPVNASDLAKSAMLSQLAQSLSGYNTAVAKLKHLSEGFADVAVGKAMDTQQVTISAANGTLTLDTGDADIGGDAFRFTISPTGKDEKGNYVYSDWAEAFMSELKDGRRAGTKLVSVNEETGERLYSMAYFEANLNTINELEYHLLEQAFTTDVKSVSANLYRVYTRNFIGVTAQDIKASGHSVCLDTDCDLTLGTGAIKATNLILSTTGSVNGSVAAAGEAGSLVQIYAEKSLGTAEQPFVVSGASTFSLHSDGDVYLRTSGDALTISTITGDNVTVNATGTAVKAVSATQPNIIGRRINYTGDLNTGLNFRTFGTTAETGGLHWTPVAGGSQDLNFGALNTAYTFWFVEEGGDTVSGKTDISYTGALNLSALKTFNGEATFTQKGDKDTGSVLVFNNPTFRNKVSFAGDGAYVVKAAGATQFNCSTASPVRISGTATLLFDKLSALSGGTVSIKGEDQLTLAGLGAEDSGLVNGNLVVQTTGGLGMTAMEVTGNTAAKAGSALVALSVLSNKNMELVSGGFLTAEICAAEGTMKLSGTWGVLGSVISAPKVVANSKESGVSLIGVDTSDLSGSSKHTFVADITPKTSGSSLYAHDIRVDKLSGSVRLRHLDGPMELGGVLEGISLELYSTGTITQRPGTRMSFTLPDKNIRRENDPTVADVALTKLEDDLAESLLWFIDIGSDSADKSCDDARKKRQEVAGEDKKDNKPAIYFDENGKAYTPEEYSKMIAKKQA